MRRLAGKIRFEINPLDEYPKNFTGHLRATLKSGAVKEIRQGFMRGGAHAPMSTAEVETKCVDNVMHGGWSHAQAQALRAMSATIFSAATLAALSELRA